jgi:nitrite reductase (NO-forming)
VLIWAVAEGFGGPYTSGASDIGTAIIYAVVFVGLLALMAYTGPARYSVDYYLEQKISWWWKVAEIRRPVQDAPATAAAATTAGPAASAPAVPALPLTAGLAGPAGPVGPAASDGRVPAGQSPA